MPVIFTIMHGTICQGLLFFILLQPPCKLALPSLIALATLTWGSSVPAMENGTLSQHPRHASESCSLNRSMLWKHVRIPYIGNAGKLMQTQYCMLCTS